MPRRKMNQQQQQLFILDGAPWNSLTICAKKFYKTIEFDSPGAATDGFHNSLQILASQGRQWAQLFLIEANDCNRFKEAEAAMVAGFGKRATRPTWLMDTSIQRVQTRDVAAAIKQASNDEYYNYNETWMQVDEKEEVEKLETTEKAKYCTSSENVFSWTMTEYEKAGQDEDDVLAELVALLELRSLRREMNLEAAAASGGILAEDSLPPSPERDRVHSTFTFTGSQRQHDTAIRGGDDDDEDDEEEEEEDRVLSTPPEEMGRTRI
ncbi:hypothetical protein BGX33_001459 [Mortierella sp. NVP41]|nr:hypothetical protein BGX33_001459 [Mortierella sp. NVP41]